MINPKHIVCAIALSVAGPMSAQSVPDRDGWTVHNTAHAFGDLVKRVQGAVKAAPINIISQASASNGAKQQGYTIPGNRVIGIYRNDYARRMLDASIAAGIEAPLRLYITENDDGTASLSYRGPSVVFSPYMDEGGDGLRELAEELDGIFADIAKEAVGS